MTSDRWRVFVSSRMAELSAERAAVKAVLDELNIDAWVFERDAGARAGTIQDSYKDEVEAADLFIGIFWKGYGDYTIDEFEHAQKTNKDCLVYQKGGDNVEGRDPRLEAFLKRIGDVETGITVQFFDTADELAEMVGRDATRWETGIIRGSRQEAAGGAGAAYGLDPNLAVLARKVQQAWIDGVLAGAITESGVIDVAKESRPDATHGGFEAVLDLPDAGRSVVEAGTTPVQTFDQVKGSLLILGHPGSGKTTTALQITRELLRRSARDASLPVPVVLNISAWTGAASSLLAWIVRELSAKYQIPGQFSRGWLQQSRLVLVLDGLDEVADNLQTQFVKSLNRYLKKYPPGGLVVASGLDEYESLPVKLRTRGAISLQPLSPKQIDAYLEDGGEALAGLREAVKTDAALRQLAKSPLMLSIMSLAYRSRAAEELKARAVDSIEERRARLFETYVDRSFEQRSRRGSYSRKAMTSWLSWIARGMERRHQTMFLVENLQPSWLERRWYLAAYLVGVAIFMSALGGAMIIVYRATTQRLGDSVLTEPEEAMAWIFGLLIWTIGIGIADSLRPRSLRPRSTVGNGSTAWWVTLRMTLINVAIYGPLSLPLLYLVQLSQMNCDDCRTEVGNWLIPVLSMTLAFSYLGRRHGLTRHIHTTESLWLEWRAARRGALWGMVIGLLLAYSPLFSDPDEPRIGAAIFWWLLTVGLCAIFGGFRARIVTGKTMPNQGIVLTWRTALRASVLAIPIVAMVPAAHMIAYLLDKFGMVSYTEEMASHLAEQTGAALILFTLFIWLWFGGLEVGKNGILRAVIGATRLGPWSFTRLLNEAGARQLMRRAGGGYLFVHGFLQEHFAAMDLPPPARNEVHGSDQDQRALSASTVLVSLLALIGVIALVIGFYIGAVTAKVTGGVLVALAVQWVVIRLAVSSVLHEREDSDLT